MADQYYFGDESKFGFTPNGGSYIDLTASSRTCKVSPAGSSVDIGTRSNPKRKKTKGTGGTITVSGLDDADVPDWDSADLEAGVEGVFTLWPNGDDSGNRVWTWPASVLNDAGYTSEINAAAGWDLPFEITGNKTRDVVA